jgi:hypothetical protein
MGLKAQKQTPQPVKASKASSRPKSAKRVRGATLSPQPESMEAMAAEKARLAEEKMQVDEEPEETAPVRKAKGLKAKAKRLSTDAEGSGKKVDYVELYEKSQKMGKRHR